MAVVFAGVGSEASAQEVLFLNPDAAAIANQSRNRSLSSLDGVEIIDSSPLFLEQMKPNPGGVGSSLLNQVNGTSVRSGGSGNFGNLSVGFDYLRPWWTFRDFNLTVPPAYAGAFPSLATIGNTDNHFAFVPRVQYDYYLSSWDIGIGASGKVLNLQGSVQRNVATAGGEFGNLVSNANLTIVSINPLEFTKSYYMDDLLGDKVHKDTILDSKVDLTIGSRFVQLNQNYTGSMQGGVGATSIATRYTTQNYSGFGLTSAINLLCPISDHFVGFSNVRGSILAGENRRNSTLSIAAAGLPGVADIISDVKTQFVPIVEMEIGVEWGMDLGEMLRRRETKQQLTVRVAGLGQYWGGMGPLSAGSSQGFQTNNLFLTGVSVQVGFRH